jgi:pilus assembly protein FimV
MHGRKDVKPFGVLATELFNATGGVGAEWEKAVAMGLQLDPGIRSLVRPDRG